MNEICAEKAQRLVDEGRVSITFSDDSAIYGRVRAVRVIYTVTLYQSGNFHCGCEWALSHNYTSNLCVHALAVKLAVGKTI